MIWLIILLVIGLFAFVGYRLYTAPPLPSTARQQQERYIQAFQVSKTLIYQMPPADQNAFSRILARHYFNAGAGCFYGTDLMIHLLADESQVTIHLFCPNQHDLTRHTWKVMQLKNQVGGSADGAPDG